MNRSQKAEVVTDLGMKLKSAKVALLAKYQGLTVAQTNQFRRELRQAAGECQVTKNTLARRAFGDSPYGSAERWLEGQTALVFGYEDAVAVSKVVARWAETESEKFWIKGGIFEGELLEPKSVVELAKTPSKDVLRATLLGLLQAPASNLVRLLAEPGAQLARLLAARGTSLGGDTDNS